jgi:hypothetical protein
LTLSLSLYLPTVQLGDMLSFFGFAEEEETKPKVEDSTLRQRELMDRQRALDLEYYQEKKKKVEAAASAKEDGVEKEEEEEETKQENDRVSEDSLPPLPTTKLKRRNACCVVM